MSGCPVSLDVPFHVTSLSSISRALTILYTTVHKCVYWGLFLESVDLILSLVCPWLVTSNDQYLYLFQM